MEIETIIKQLAAPYYTRQNLALILGNNRRTLDYRLAQLVIKGVLDRIKPGFYLNKSLLLRSPQQTELLEYVGSVLKYPSYVSLSYALSKYGVIPESVYTIAYITTKKTNTFATKDVSFSYRNIKQALFSDYKVCQFNQQSYFFAQNYKALFDLIYLTPFSTTANLEQFLFESRFNWGAFSSQDKNQLLNLCTKSGSSKMRVVVKLLTQRGIL